MTMTLDDVFPTIAQRFDATQTGATTLTYTAIGKLTADGDRAIDLDELTDRDIADIVTTLESLDPAPGAAQLDTLREVALETNPLASLTAFEPGGAWDQSAFTPARGREEYAADMRKRLVAQKDALNAGAAVDKVILYGGDYYESREEFFEAIQGLN